MAVAGIREIHGEYGTTYEVYWREGKNQPSRSFKTKAEALALKKSTERHKRLDKDRGFRSVDRIKYADWSVRWFDEAVSELTQKVQSQYERYSNANILPYWSKVALNDILPDKLPAWVKWMQKREIATSSIHESMVVFRSSLSYAVEMRLLPQNPAAGRKRYMPRYEPSRERPMLTPAQVTELGVYAGDDRLMFMVMAVLALRPGEAIGPRAGDVRKGYLSLLVERSVVKAPGIGMVEGRTKNRKARRVPMMIFAKELEALAQGRPKDDLLFPGPNGRWMNGDTLRYRVKRSAQRAGLPRVNADDLRHIALTNALEFTESVKFAAELAGHESGPTITLKHYAKLTKAMEKTAIEKLSAAYGASPA